MDKFLHGSAEHSGGAWRLTGQRRDAPASGTLKALCGCVCQRPGVHRPCIPEPLPLLGHPLWLLSIRRESSTVPVCCPSPAPGAHWRTMHVQPSFCRGRYEGTALLLWSQRALWGLLCTHLRRRQSLHTCVVRPHWRTPTHRNQVRTCDRLSTALGPGKRKKSTKTALRGSVSLDTGSPHKGSARTSSRILRPAACSSASATH
jgi:hypothetical protein